MSELSIYWWLKLDDIQTLFIVIGVISTSVIVLVATEIGRKILWFLIPSTLFFVLATFMPSSKQYAVIKVLPTIANSEIAKELPNDAKEMYRLAKDYFKEQLSPEEK